jgi:hypothetical protein
VGLGELGLTPREFWRLSPHEFTVMFEGFQRRQDREWERIAVLGLWVLAPHTKKKLTVAELLGRRLKTLPVTDTPADNEALVEAERTAVLARALAWAQE